MPSQVAAGARQPHRQSSCPGCLPNFPPRCCPAPPSPQRGGETIFSGAVGADASNRIAYCSAIDGVAPIKPRINPANWCGLGWFGRVESGATMRRGKRQVQCCNGGALA